MCRRKLSAAIVKWSSSPWSSQAALEDGAGEEPVLRLGRRERREVVLSRDQRSRRLERVEVERPRPPERAPVGEGRADAAAQDPVAVRAGRADEARAETLGGRLDAEDGDVGGQRRVERLGRALRRRAAVGHERRDLRRRVDAGVRPPGDGELAPAPVDRVERLAERRPRRCARRAAAPSPGSRCRRTRASASASSRPRPRSLSWLEVASTQRKYDLYGPEFRADPHARLRADARARPRHLPAGHRRRDA